MQLSSMHFVCYFTIYTNLHSYTTRYTNTLYLYTCKKLLKLRWSKVHLNHDNRVSDCFICFWQYTNITIRANCIVRRLAYIPYLLLFRCKIEVVFFFFEKATNEVVLEIMNETCYLWFFKNFTWFFFLIILQFRVEYSCEMEYEWQWLKLNCHRWQKALHKNFFHVLCLLVRPH